MRTDFHLCFEHETSYNQICHEIIEFLTIVVRLLLMAWTCDDIQAKVQWSQRKFLKAPRTKKARQLRKSFSLISLALME